MKKIQLKQLELLEILEPNGYKYYGGSQEWYKKPWQRLSGCDPTTASNQLIYLAQTR